MNFLTPFDQSPAKNTRSRTTSDAPKFSQETDGAANQSLLRQEMSAEKSTVYQIMDIDVPKKIIKTTEEANTVMEIQSHQYKLANSAKKPPTGKENVYVAVFYNGQWEAFLKFRDILGEPTGEQMTTVEEEMYTKMYISIQNLRNPSDKRPRGWKADLGNMLINEVHKN